MVRVSPENFRIVSLVPSLTHSLCELGLKNRIVGITQFCVEPPGLSKSCVIVGGTKDPDIERIADLRPTHIVTNYEENRQEDIENLKLISGAEVVETKIANYADLIQVMTQFEEIFLVDLGLEKKAVSEFLYNQTKSDLGKFLYLIWKAPYMVVGEDTFISKSINTLGYENVCPKTSSRYPELSMRDIININPDMIFFSSEPYPFRKRDLTVFKKEWLEISKLPFPKFFRIDGRFTSWYLHYSLKFLSKIQKGEVGDFLLPFTDDDASRFETIDNSGI